MEFVAQNLGGCRLHNSSNTNGKKAACVPLYLRRDPHLGPQSAVKYQDAAGVTLRRYIDEPRTRIIAGNFAMCTFRSWAATVVGLFVIVSATQADEPPSSQETVARALKFVVDDTAKWRQEKGCATCHHGVLTTWTLNEAMLRVY